MKISEIEKELKAFKEQHGDIECVIEVPYYSLFYQVLIETRPINKLSVEIRQDYGMSIKFLQ